MLPHLPMSDLADDQRRLSVVEGGRAVAGGGQGGAGRARRYNRVGVSDVTIGGGMNK